MHSLENFLAECLFRLARGRVVREQVKEDESQSGSEANYDEWRTQSLEEQFSSFFGLELIEGKDVLDFGCGFGNLSLWAARGGAKTVIGTDLSITGINRAVEAARGKNLPVEFRVASSADRIDLPNHSIDVILCFDVVEHIIEYNSIILEWRRILRSNGKILILWSPYYHPYGHHFHSYAPIPWMHLFASQRVMHKVCSKMVNLPEFNPSYWDLDEQGNRRDRFVVQGNPEFLNRLSIFKFERLCHAVGLSLERREFHTFRVLKRYPLAEKLLTLPGLREFFTSFVIYEIVSP